MGVHFAPCIIEANKVEIVQEGAVPPLLALSHSIDLKVQRNAAGALLNLTHIGQRSFYPLLIGAHSAHVLYSSRV